GIRDFHVTGVQTCALPISSDVLALSYKSLQELLSEYADAQILYREIITAHHIRLLKKMSEAHRQTTQERYLELKQLHPDIELIEIGRASCRERMKITVGEG